MCPVRPFTACLSCAVRSSLPGPLGSCFHTYKRKPRDFCVPGFCRICWLHVRRNLLLLGTPRTRVQYCSRGQTPATRYCPVSVYVWSVVSRVVSSCVLFYSVYLLKSTSKSLCVVLFIQHAKKVVAYGWIRTNDLWVMSPTSYQTAPRRIIVTYIPNTQWKIFCCVPGALRFVSLCVYCSITCISGQPLGAHSCSNTTQQVLFFRATVTPQQVTNLPLGFEPRPSFFQKEYFDC